MGLTLEAIRTGCAAAGRRRAERGGGRPGRAARAGLPRVRLVYGVGFLKAFSATPGKLLVGIEVRLRDAPGPLPWGTVLVRWLGQNVETLLRLLPVVGPVFGFGAYALVDGLWPLWDGKRQALHDKPARTSVVRR